MFNLDKKTILSLTITALLAMTNVMVSADEKLQFKSAASFDVNSDYVWRGFLLDDDPVMQMGISVRKFGLTATLWGSIDMENKDNRTSEEIDYILDFTHKLTDKLSISLGHTYYDYPLTSLYSREFYAGISLDYFLSPKLYWYRDYGKEITGGGKGDYISLDLSKTVPISGTNWTIGLTGHAGYNDKLFIKGSGGNACIIVGLSIPINEKTTVSPSIVYSLPFGDVKASSDGNQNDRVFGGVNFSF